MIKETMESLAQKEISATTRWGIGLLIGLLIQSGAVFSWAATIQAKVDQNEKDISAAQTDIKAVNDDIREILVGIEQVKARLGIVEIK